MAKKYRYRVCLSAEEDRRGFVELTRKEAQIVAYATNPQNWDDDSGCAYSGSFTIDVTNPSKCHNKKRDNAEIALFTSWILDVYRCNAVSKTLTRAEYEIVFESYKLIKERSVLIDKPIDDVWHEMQTWIVK